jgi:hypothetical protein
MKAIVSAITIGLAVTLLSCDIRSNATKERDGQATAPASPLDNNVTKEPDHPAGDSPASPMENNAFVAQQVCSTEAFRFDVPRPWRYANPDSTKKKNLARCFLNSPLRATAEGQLLVDAGKAVGTIAETSDGMTKVMRATKNIEISREDVGLDGDKAVCLKSEVADYNVPCSVIVDVHNGTLYLIMMSVSKNDQLKERDLMVQTLLRTWKWKASGTRAE